MKPLEQALQRASNAQYAVTALIESPRPTVTHEVWVGVDDRGCRRASKAPMLEHGTYWFIPHVPSMLDVSFIPAEAFEGLTCVADGQRKKQIDVTFRD